jgi:glycosyltransferase involved in cell wall biosynthesis
MSKKLGGITWGYCMESQDYNWRETIRCLSELCDEVIVLDAGSTDMSDKLLEEYVQQFENVKTVYLQNSEWQAQKGQQKLAYMQNVALSELSKEMDYYFLLQMDEIIHESSFSTIRAVIEFPYEGFLCRRFNMYGDMNHYLDVPQDRKPVSDYVMRLANPKYLSYGDGESIMVAPPTSAEFKEQIKIYHMGFVRSRKKNLIKMKHMMEDIFGWGLDPRAQGKDKFYPFDFFAPADCVHIREPLPKFIENWVKERAHEFESF